MKPLIIIDPGHGGKDPGGGSNSQFVEKNMVLQISLYQLERFRELSVPVAITRTEDVYLSPSERTAAVRESGAKFCISNHINAARPGARGAETIHSIFSDGKLANALYRAIVDEGMPGRRVFAKSLPENPKKDYYFMHRETGAVETVIVEYGFATDPEDTKLIIENWKRYAEAVVRSFCQFVDHPYAPPFTVPEPVKQLPQIQRTATVIIDGQSIGTGYLIDNSVYVPLRAVADTLGVKVLWDNSRKTAIIEKGRK